MYTASSLGCCHGSESSHVAKMRDTIIGQHQQDNVGYHVGQNNMSNNTTELIYLLQTAVILLEDLRANGIEALTRYKCVLIDECHEKWRSFFGFERLLMELPSRNGLKVEEPAKISY